MPSVSSPRARFTKVAQFRCANNVRTARPSAVGNARRLEKHVPRRGSEGRKRKGWNLCSPKSVIESQKRADAWERIWRSGDGNGLSKYRRRSEWLRGNTVESISRLADTSSRTSRTCERSSRRASAAVCPIQTLTRRVSLPNIAGGGRRGLVPTVRSSQGAGKGIQRGSERAERAPDGTTLHVGVCNVRQWPSGIGCGPVSRCLEHSRDPSERRTSANSGEISDANARPCSSGGCAEYQQAGTHSPQSPPSIERGSNRKARHHRRTTSERYRVTHRRKRAGRPSPVHEVFLLICCGPFGWGPVLIVFQVDQSLPTMALRLLASVVVFVAWTA